MSTLIEQKTSRFEKSQQLKLSPEYMQSQFIWVVSLLITAILLVSSYDFAGNAIKPIVFAVFAAYALFTLIQILITWLIRRDILTNGEIRPVTRRLGYLQLFSVLTGNIFTVIFAMHLIKKKTTSQYTLAVYLLITQIFIIVLSSLNLFKPYVTDTFLPAMFVLAGIAVFYFVSLTLVAKFVDRRQAPKWMIYIAVPLLLTSITGNLFALLLGLDLLFKIRQTLKPGSGNWERIWNKITRNVSSMFGLFFILFMFAISVSSFFTFDYDMAIQNNYSAILQTPSLAYPLGTDHFGRDLFSRIVFGARISLVVGFISTLIPVIIGGILGALAGYYGRHTDNIIMRLLDVLYAIPGILLAIAIIAAFGANTTNLIIALSIGSIPTYARTMRANVLMVSNYEYVDAARAFGSSNLSIIFRHIVPNSFAPMIVKSTLTIGGAVIATSSLSYLGLGVEPHIPEWGNILKVGSTYLESHSYLAIYPGLAIVALVLSFNFLGDGLRDALDPKLD
ncbi:ABC transporter permease [Paenibacillus sp. Marseille-Q4541]|uniref:ABC transporter permease n=1 Tax=Paenibacillus sp. Marseille-Q4541 TaxID=2831522 RepID=UPI001BA9A01C|nr:ABC transporter permease [Paenibacillus sp. Marseille-Q4541]